MMVIDMVTGEIEQDSYPAQKSVEKIAKHEQGLQMPRDLEPGLQVFEPTATDSVGGFPDSLVDVNIDTFIGQVSK
jgi:hypothetical protein